MKINSGNLINSPFFLIVANDALLELIKQNPGGELKIASFYDGAANSGFHICKYCNRKFAIIGSTNKCPYCNNPLYR
ncbi:MAG: hypothetical protein ACFFDW_01305 [Candidatus Thorarchaeota archaeon]